MVTHKETPGRTRQKTKDLSACESKKRGRGEGGGVYDTLMKSDAVEPSGRAQGPSPVIKRRASGWVSGCTRMRKISCRACFETLFQ